MHRIGRVARAGKKGEALLFLTPRTDAYVEFMAGKDVPLRPFPQVSLGAPLPHILEGVRKAAKSDRAIMEKAQNAFVSWVRA